MLYRSFDIGEPVLVIKTPGTLTGDNVLTDTSGRTWLTDFADAGLAPLLWNVVALEAVIRFDWVDAHDLQALHDMEQCLIESPFSKLATSDVESSLRRPVRAIQMLRRLAVQTVGAAPLPYHLGILFQAASRLIGFNPASQLTTNELMRLSHTLIAAAMLCGKIEMEEWAGNGSITPEKTGLQLDEANRVAWVDGVRVAMSKHSYEMFRYLYAHPDQLCTRQALVEQVFGQTYDETDSS